MTLGKESSAGDLSERLRTFNRRKRCIDVAVVLASLPVVLPLGITLGVLLLWQQGRPIMYRQERLGYNERIFRIYKFRTMSDARDPQGRLLPDMRRLTVIGAFLRKTSLDELPQLLNVLRGDMSLIGPRPLFPRYLYFYSQRERRRHLVRPGLTGLAQVNGRNLIDWDTRFALDVEYVDRASIRLDAVVFVQTLKRLVGRSGVAVIAGTTGKPLDIAREYPYDRDLFMRPLRLEDLETRVLWMNDPGTRAFMRISGDITLESTLEWFNANRSQGGKHDFVVVDVATGQIVAMTGLRERDPRQVESYILVAPGERGRGVGFRSQRLLLLWAFRSGHYDTVISSVRQDNTASYRMHRKFAGEVIPVSGGRDEIVIYRDAFLGRFIGRAVS